MNGGGGGDATRQAGVVLTADTSGYDQPIEESAAKTSKLATAVDDLFAKLGKISKVAGASLVGIGAADVAMITKATSAYADHEKQLAGLAAQSKITGRSFDAMAGTVDKLRRNFPVSTADAAALVGQLQKMRDGSAPVEKLAETFTKLGGATGENVQGLTQSLLSLQKMMGAPQKDTERYASVLTKLAASSQSSATGISQFAEQLAPLAKTAGMSTTEVLGVSKAFADAGQDGYRAANSFNQMLGDITRSISTGSPDIAKYANLLGVTNDQFAKMGPTDAIGKIFEQINALGPDAIQVLNRMGIDGVRAVSSFQAVAQGGGIEKAIAQATGEFNKPGALQRGQEGAFGGISSEMTKLSSQFSEIAESIGKTFAPVAEGFLKGANLIVGAINAIAQSPLGQLASMFAGLIAPVTGAAGALLMAAPALLKAAGVVQLFKGAHTAGFKDARSGFTIREGGVMPIPLPGGGAVDPTRPMTREGMAYMGQHPEGKRLGIMGRALYGVGMTAGAMAPAYGSMGGPGSMRSLASRTAGLAPWMVGAGSGLLSSFLAPAFPGNIDDTTGRPRLFQGDKIRDMVKGGFVFDEKKAREFYAGEDYRKNLEQGMSPRAARWQMLKQIGTTPWMAGPQAGADIQKRAAATFAKEFAQETKNLPKVGGEVMGPLTPAQQQLKDLNDQMKKADLRSSQFKGPGKIASFFGFGGTPEGGLNAAAKETDKATQATKGFGSNMGFATRKLGVFTGDLGKATIGLSKMAAPSVASGLKSAGSGLMGLVGGPWGLAAMAGIGGGIWGINKYKESTKSGLEGFEIEDSASYLEAYTGSLAKATTGVESFAEAMRRAEESLPTPTTKAKAMEITAQEIGIAVSPMYKRHGGKPVPFSPTSQARMIGAQYSEYSPEELQDLKMDLIDQYDAGTAGRILDMASKQFKNENLNFGAVMGDLKNRDEDTQARLLKELMTASHVQNEQIRYSQGDAAANRQLNKDMGAFFKQATAKGSPFDERTTQGAFNPLSALHLTAHTSQEKQQFVDAFREKFFPEMKKEDIGYSEGMLFGQHKIELQKYTEMAAQGEDWRKALIADIREEFPGRKGKELVAPFVEGGQYERKGQKTPEELKEERYAEAAPTIGPMLFENQKVKAAMEEQENINKQFLARQELEKKFLQMGPRKAYEEATALMGAAGSPESAEYQLAQFGLQGMQRQQSFAAAAGETIAGVAGAGGSRIQALNLARQQWAAYRTPTQTQMEDPAFMQARDQAEEQWEAQRASARDFLAQLVGALRQYNIMKGRAEEDFATQQERALYDFNLQRDRAEFEFHLQRRRATADFNRQRERAEYDFNLQRKYASFDFHLQEQRSLTDYNIQRNRAEQSYERQRRQSHFDYNLQRKRSDADYQLQVKRMIEDSAKTMYNVYERISTKPTWSGEGLVTNMQDQVTEMQEQADNLDRARRMGLSGKAIRMLDLANPENAQQLESLIGDMADNPNVIRRMNKVVKDRIKATSSLVRDEDNTAFQRMEHDYEKSVRRGEGDFKRAMRRGHREFRISMNQMQDDFERAMDRGRKDFRRSMHRNHEAFELSMEQQAEDFKRSMHQGRVDFKRQMDQSAEDFKTANGRMREDFAKSMKRAKQDIGEMAHEITGSFSELMERLEGKLGNGVDHMMDKMHTGLRNFKDKTKKDLNDTKEESTGIASDMMTKLADIFNIDLKTGQPKSQGAAKPNNSSDNTPSTGGGGKGNPGNLFGGMAQGGTIPGWTPGQDVHKFTSPTGGTLNLSGGEAVMIPQFTQAMGGEPGIAKLNQMAREGKLERGFAQGGVFRNPDKKVQWGDDRISAIAAAQLKLAERISGQQITMMQGGYGGNNVAASGTSHDYPGVADVAPATIRMEKILRQVGFAAWARNIPGRYNVGSGDHIHAVSLIDPGNAGHDQFSSWRTHTTGLEGNDPDQAPHYPWIPNLLKILGAMNLSALAGAGGFGGAGAGVSLQHLPGMKDAYPSLESIITASHVMSKLFAKNAMSGMINRWMRQAAKKFARQHDIPIHGGMLGFSGGGGFGAAVGDFGANAKGVWNALISAGFGEIQAAGIMGNMMSESHFDPLIVQNDGRSTNPANISVGYGLVQWTPGSKLVPYLHGQKPSVATEVSAIAAQLSGKGPSPEAESGRLLRNAKSPSDAASIFELKYERHDGGAQPERLRQAEAIYRRFGHSKNHALGGIFQAGARDITVGEAGPEAVLPLNQRGVDFLESLMRRMSAGHEARGGPVRGSVPCIHNTTNNYKVDRSTNFTGDISVQAQDPSELVRKLEAKKRMQALTQPVLARSS